MAPTLAFLGNIGMPELIVIGLVALLLFGRRLPEVARNLGRGITEFKRGVNEASDQVKREMDVAASEAEAKARQQPAPNPAAQPAPLPAPHTAQGVPAEPAGPAAPAVEQKA